MIQESMCMQSRDMYLSQTHANAQVDILVLREGTQSLPMTADIQRRKQSGTKPQNTQNWSAERGLSCYVLRTHPSMHASLRITNALFSVLDSAHAAFNAPRFSTREERIHIQLLLQQGK